MPIVTNSDIQKFKETKMMYWIYDYVKRSIFWKVGMV
jgi:hypothetical protein